MSKLLIRNGRVIDPAVKFDGVADLLVDLQAAISGRRAIIHAARNMEVWKIIIKIAVCCCVVERFDASNGWFCACENRGKKSIANKSAKPILWQCLG